MERLPATLLEFSQTPRTRKEIAAFLGIGTASYAMQHYVQPLLIEGKLEMTMPEKLRSRHQKTGLYYIDVWGDPSLTGKCI